MKEKKKRERPQTNGNANSTVTNAVNAMRNNKSEKIASDVLGSYTGTGDNGAMPEQDADDL